jgi:hypothetical protein
MTPMRRTSSPTVSVLLSHVLENPNLIAAVRELPGATLGRLVDSIGLEDAAELVALATTEQLESVFDEDLWKAEPEAMEERFDPTRFALWLHAFSEAGQEAVVRRLLELPLDFLILAVHRLVLVLDIEALAVEMSGSRRHLEHIEKALDSRLYQEWEEFRLISRDDSAFDELSSVLFALDRDHHGLLRQILERCASMSTDWIEENGGLYDVLTSDEMLEADVRGERDDRRARRGYVSTADARAFLKLCRAGAGDLLVRDAITKAHFRELPSISREGVPRGKAPAVRTAASDTAALLELLGRANVLETPRGKGLSGASTRRLSDRTVDPQGLAVAGPTRLVDAALAGLRERAQSRYDERMRELAYLANVLVAASKSQHRHWRPIEALEAAVEITNMGLVQAVAGSSRRSTEDTLEAAITLLGEATADRLFRRACAELCSNAAHRGPAIERLRALMVDAPSAPPAGRHHRKD